VGAISVGTPYVVIISDHALVEAHTFDAGPSSSTSSSTVAPLTFGSLILSAVYAPWARLSMTPASLHLSHRLVAVAQ
jgi:hypothetical protein